SHEPVVETHEDEKPRGAQIRAKIGYEFTHARLVKAGVLGIAVALALNPGDCPEGGFEAPRTQRSDSGPGFGDERAVARPGRSVISRVPVGVDTGAAERDLDDRDKVPVTVGQGPGEPDFGPEAAVDVAEIAELPRILIDGEGIPLGLRLQVGP